MTSRPTAKDLKIRDDAAAGADKLREIGEPAFAAAVDYLLSPKGWPMLGRLHAASGGSHMSQTLGITMQRPVREHIKASANAAGETLAEVVHEGLRAFIDGQFQPPRPTRAAYGTGDKVNLNVRVGEGLRQQADALGAAMKDELGWQPRTSTVATAWLLHRYPLPEDAGTASTE